MKKKVLSAMLVATMTATMFAGCGSDKGTTNDTQGGSASNDKVETQDVKLLQLWDLPRIRMMHRGHG